MNEITSIFVVNWTLLGYFYFAMHTKETGPIIVTCPKKVKVHTTRVWNLGAQDLNISIV